MTTLEDIRASLDESLTRLVELVAEELRLPAVDAEHAGDIASALVEGHGPRLFTAQSPARLRKALSLLRKIDPLIFEPAPTLAELRRLIHASRSDLSEPYRTEHARQKAARAMRIGPSELRREAYALRREKFVTTAPTAAFCDEDPREGAEA